MTKTAKLVDARVTQKLKDDTAKACEILGIKESVYIEKAVMELNKKVLKGVK
jgi:antitoxin component of RelBE/YafQ-DinJ toxin-antitoxin module